MSLAVAVTDQWHDGKRQHIVGTLTFSSNYASGGESFDFAAQSWYRSTRQPLYIQALGKAGYVYAYDFANKKWMVFYGDNNNAADGPLVELPAASYPAGVTGDAVRFYAIAPVGV